MHASPTTLTLATSLLLAPTLAPQDSREALDPSRAALLQRASTAGPAAEAPASPGAAGSGVASASAGGTLLFSMVGADNAECVRSTPDVNGDGLDEVLVGIGTSGGDNLFCLDGASSGTASVLWQLQTNGGLSGGSCYGDQSIVPSSDSEGSGDANILVGTAWGGRTAYDLDTLAGAEVWRFDTYQGVASGWVYSLCEISDVTGDGVPEAAFGVGSDGDALILVDGASSGPQADVIWRYQAADAVYSVRNLGDVNADGSDDVLAAVGDNGDVLVCLEGDSSLPGGNVLWSYDPGIGVGVFACGVLSDVTGDGVDEAVAVLWTTSGSAIRCLNGTNGALVWSSTDVSEYGMAVDQLEDVTGDGKNELVVSSWENAAIVLDGDDGALVWKSTVGTLNGGDVWTARAIDDLDGDGLQDVVAGSFDGNVYAMDGASGDVFWSYDTGNRVFSVYPVGDLDGDGRPEVAAGTQDTTSNVVLVVLDGNAGLCGSAVSYCTAGTSAAGCQATLSASGSASATATSGFTVTAVEVQGQRNGLFFYGQSGRQAQPWGNGTSLQCVTPPVKRGGVLVGTGTAGACDGSFTQDLNARWCPTCPKPTHAPVVGQPLQLQLWYRDPQSTSNQPTSLSNALEATVCP
jgi:outer membrane protein assembly factor BamB